MQAVFHDRGICLSGRPLRWNTPRTILPCARSYRRVLPEALLEQRVQLWRKRERAALAVLGGAGLEPDEAALEVHLRRQALIKRLRTA